MLSKDKSNKPYSDKTSEQYEASFKEGDSTGIVMDIEKKTKRAIRAANDWTKAAKEDYNFALGKQWTQEEKDKLETEGRPALVYNKIEPLLDLVSGYQRENSVRIRVNPEGGEDRLFSEVADRLIKAIDKWTKLNYKLDHVFDDGETCGKGNLEMYITYDDDPIRGDLGFRLCSPYQILWDPDSTEYDKSDARHAVKVSKRTKEDLKDLYPKKAAEIDVLGADVTEYYGIGEDVLKEGDKDNYHLGREDDYKGDLLSMTIDEKEKYLLKEMFYVKMIDKHVLFWADENRFERFDTADEANQRANEIRKQAQDDFAVEMQGFQKLAMSGAPSVQQAPPAPPVYTEPTIKIIKRKVKEMWYAATAAGIVLSEPAKGPFEPYYHGYPYFTFVAKYKPNAEGEELKNRGIVRNLVDPQKDHNKSRSQYLHILNSSANSGWVGDTDALTPEGKEDLKRMGSTPGVNIWIKPGSRFEKIQPTSPSQGHLQIFEVSAQDIKEISGINADALAIQDKTTSGRAIALRIKQATTILSPIFRNYRFTKEMIGGAIFAMIPHIFDVPEIRKVVGQEFMTANKIDDGFLTAVLQQISDGKYDVVITEADNSATIRQETFDALMEMVKGGMPMPPDVLLEFSSIPNVKEVSEKIMAYQQQQAAAQAKPGA